MTVQENLQAIEQQQKEVKAREQDLSKVEAEAERIKGKKIPQRRFGKPVTKETQQQVIRQKAQASQVISEIKKERSKLTEVRSKLAEQRQKQKAIQITQTLISQGRVPSAQDLRENPRLKTTFQRIAKETGFFKSPRVNLPRSTGAIEQQIRGGELAPTGERIESTVFVDGMGFTVRKEDRQEFLEQQQAPTDIPERVVTVAPERTIIERIRGKIEGFLGEDKFVGLRETFSLESVRGLPGEVKRADVILKEKLFDPVGKIITEETGVTVESFSTAAGEFSTSAISFIDVTETGKAARKSISEFQAGITESVIRQATERTLTSTLIFTAGGVVGASAKLAGLGIETVGGAGALKGVEIATSFVGLGLGGKFVFETGFEAISTGEARGAGRVVGRAGAEAALLAVGISSGISSAERAFDIFRTRGLKELAPQEVIAPEFFKGQQFPKVRPGQTAAELRAEFFKTMLPTEKVILPRGFTAAPASFKADTLIMRGTSEVPGLFSAPKISPSFLRVGGEKVSVISFTDFLGVKRPTAIRLKFASLEFAPGVTPKTKVGRGDLRSFKSFFESLEGTGRTVIPGAKTEKEAITAFGSLIRKTGQDFFFEFGGRRIPIEQFEVLSVVKKGGTITTLGEVVSTSSSQRIVSRSILSPIQLGSVSVLSKLQVSSISISPISISRVPPSVSIPSTVSRPSLPKRGLSPLTPPSIPSTPSIPSRGISALSLPSISPPSRPLRRPPTRKPPVAPPFRPPTSQLKRQPKLSKMDKLVAGFRTFIRVRGKFVKLPGIRPRGVALRRGAERVKGGLGATFRIRKTKVRVPRGLRSFIPSMKVFRSFRIVKGKRVKLKDTFIQRTRAEGGLPGGRLAFPTEVKQIKLAKMKL